MEDIMNLYCDESCHLPSDGEKIMVLGGIWCSKNQVRKINEDIREIKKRHGISTEMKWVKISEAKKKAYLDLINYFFDSEFLNFRVLVVDNKKHLNHELYAQTHDEWYYKMYFDAIKLVLDLGSPCKFNIYLDIKDTKSKSKITKLTEVLSNDMHDFSHSRINNMQVIRSHEVEIMQIVDVLIGAVAYVSRGLNKVSAKQEVIDLIRKRSGYALVYSTTYGEKKFNIFHLHLREGEA